MKNKKNITVPTSNQKTVETQAKNITVPTSNQKTVETQAKYITVRHPIKKL
jgi:hypothetical protein